ncbi:MAG: hypothetical protein ACK5H1_09420 [Tenacibaculum sp.]
MIYDLVSIVHQRPLFGEDTLFISDFPALGSANQGVFTNLC